MSIGSLAIYERMYGPDHPLVATSLTARGCWQDRSEPFLLELRVRLKLLGNVFLRKMNVHEKCGGWF